MALAAWKAHVRASWPQVRVEPVDVQSLNEVLVGGEFHVHARVHLGPLTPSDVSVELYKGRVDPTGEIMEAEALSMHPLRQDEEGVHLYQTDAVTCRGSGLHGYTIRVLPHHPDLTTSFLPGLIGWA